MHIHLFAVCLVSVLSCSLSVYAFEEDPFSYHEVDAEGYWVKAGGGGGLKTPPENYSSSINRTLATGYFLSEAAETQGARCLDGTPGLYYMRPGFGSGVNKWLIHHQGGGWCQSLNCTEEPCPLDSCYVRSGGSLGSTKHDRDALILEGGYFDADPAINPSFYDWNIVLLRYCDGGSFSGLRGDTVTVGDRELHFRGFAILQAMIDDLLINRGLHASTDVVISGCSAGGLATYLHLDYWAERIHSVALGALVVGMPDSGFFLDYQDPIRQFHSGLKFVFEEFNSTNGVDKDCVAAYAATSETWRCIFAERISPFISTPLLALQSRFDSWQTAMDLDSTDHQQINQWGERTVELMRSSLLAHNGKHAAFIDSCAHHCNFWNQLESSDGLTQPMAFQRWYSRISQGQMPETQEHFRLEPFPCEACCGSSTSIEISPLSSPLWPPSPPGPPGSLGDSDGGNDLVPLPAPSQLSKTRSIVVVVVMCLFMILGCALCSYIHIRLRNALDKMVESTNDETELMVVKDVGQLVRDAKNPSAGLAGNVAANFLGTVDI
mmetsp:Transcript_7094/g.14333  ORF Transcript_7094/g.14333 Transcript_7094/m.14333 type:complete len:550 (-) Transcript_7094:148-1797(-)